VCARISMPVTITMPLQHLTAEGIECTSAPLSPASAVAESPEGESCAGAPSSDAATGCQALPLFRFAPRTIMVKKSARSVVLKRRAAAVMCYAAHEWRSRPTCQQASLYGECRYSCSGTASRGAGNYVQEQAGKSRRRRPSVVSGEKAHKPVAQHNTFKRLREARVNARSGFCQNGSRSGKRGERHRWQHPTIANSSKSARSQERPAHRHGLFVSCKEIGDKESETTLPLMSLAGNHCRTVGVPWRVCF